MDDKISNPKLILDSIQLVQFKNFDKIEIQFNNVFNAIVGDNGKGKTNILDAIYTLSFTKSYFSKNDNLNVKFGNQGFRIFGKYLNKNLNEEVEIIYRENGRKELNHNKESLKKYSSFIGKLPTIMICPDDIELINGISEIRRNFIDKFISQIDIKYLETLINYQKIILQKNAILKNWHLNKQKKLLEIYNEQLTLLVNSIYNARKIYIEKLINYTKENYMFLSGFEYEINLTYLSQLENNTWEKLVSEYNDKECLLQRTLVGTHKDDFIFKLHNLLFKDIASQGQKKSLLLALKTAETKIIHDYKDIYPIILLDDIFEKLDDLRLNKLFELLLKNNKMQLFITDVNEERIKNKILNVCNDYKIINI